MALCKALEEKKCLRVQELSLNYLVCQKEDIYHLLFERLLRLGGLRVLRLKAVLQSDLITLQFQSQLLQATNQPREDARLAFPCLEELDLSQSEGIESWSQLLPLLFKCCAKLRKLDLSACGIQKHVSSFELGINSLLDPTNEYGRGRLLFYGLQELALVTPRPSRPTRRLAGCLARP